MQHSVRQTVDLIVASVGAAFASFSTGTGLLSITTVFYYVCRESQLSFKRALISKSLKEPQVLI